MKKCNNCGTKSCANNGKIGVPIGCNDYTPPMQQTNADRIRAMTDKELASFLSRSSPCVMPCPPGRELPFPCEIGCKACWLNWLKSPVEVDNGT